MIEPDRVAAILLAAGRASRFGADKLMRQAGGQALGQYAAQALLALPFRVRVAVISARGIRYDAAGFTEIVNDHAGEGLASSLRLGVAQARHHDVDAVLIALADMPFVPPSHLLALLGGYENGDSLLASKAGHASPPALFGRNWFGRLASLQGDSGAKAWLAGARAVPCDASWLRDIDTPADLEASGLSGA